jgi:hypothetical protein
VLRLTADSKDNEATSTMNNLERVLSTEALRAGLTSIGLPFVTQIAQKTNKDNATENSITVCAAIPIGSPKPSGGVSVSLEPHRQGLAVICDAAELDHCSSALETAMTQAPWLLSKATLDAATRRDHPALTDDPSAENAINSLTHARDILIAGAKTADTSPGLLSSKVVVAILLDVALVLAPP